MDEWRGVNVSQAGPVLTVNASPGRVPFSSCGSLYEPGAFQELDENSVHERVLDQGLHQHHSLLPQLVQHPWDVEHLDGEMQR